MNQPATKQSAPRYYVMRSDINRAGLVHDGVANRVLAFCADFNDAELICRALNQCDCGVGQRTATELRGAK